MEVRVFSAAPLITKKSPFGDFLLCGWRRRLCRQRCNARGGCCRFPCLLTSQRLVRKKSTSVDFCSPNSRTALITKKSPFGDFLLCGWRRRLCRQRCNARGGCCRFPCLLTSQRLVRKKSTSVDFCSPNSRTALITKKSPFGDFLLCGWRRRPVRRAALNCPLTAPETAMLWRDV